MMAPIVDADDAVNLLRLVAAVFKAAEASPSSTGSDTCSGVVEADADMIVGVRGAGPSVWRRLWVLVDLVVVTVFQAPLLGLILVR